MHKDKYVFAQLVEFLDRNHFNYLVRKYLGDKYIEPFSCWNQLLVMMFGQLAKSESLQDLIIALEAYWRKLYHLGMGKSVTRSNLAKTNEQRDHRIFEDFAYHLVAAARSKSTEKILDLMVTSRPLIQLRQTFVSKFLSEPSFVSMKGELRFTPSMTLKHSFLHSFILQRHQPTI